MSWTCCGELKETICPVCQSRALGLPVLVVAQEIVRIPVVHGGSEEQARNPEVTHLLETSVGGVDSAANDTEAMSLHLLAEQVVLGEGDLLVKSAQFAKFLRLEQHEHAGSEGSMPTREVLTQIVAGVKQLVNPASVATQDICSYAMQVLALR